MEKRNYYLIIIVVILIICLGWFCFHFNDTSTAIVFNQSEVLENESFSGMLVDFNGNGISNKTIIFHKPGYEFGTIVDVITDNEGRFVIENAEYLPDTGSDNYYGDFTFAGDDDYQGCAYNGNITVIPK